MGQQQTSTTQQSPSLFKETIPTNNSSSLSNNDQDGLNQVFSFKNSIHFQMTIPKQLYDINSNDEKVSQLTMMAWIKPTKSGDVRIFDSYVTTFTCIHIHVIYP
ncbi:predicted protein [Naegleria gruberi]|uniref:Predicted protein n=1 Tax=Naegleria gruberi TaxID=5762 RepID=D2VZ96_NAEGR|nr:uncharacterized protein NAEGRDRAFT_74413 [Naegleria gruberi]EFC37806.1 predicted protein [Naegleria gruberi]|eukprot:XP_002670550.1 predicted protein [Naegleria gruberi strain NEG-M]